jgi:hypothetical protein
VAPCIHLTFLPRQLGQAICPASSGPRGAVTLKRVWQSGHTNSQGGGPAARLPAWFSSISCEPQRGQFKPAEELPPWTLNSSSHRVQRKPFMAIIYYICLTAIIKSEIYFPVDFLADSRAASRSSSCCHIEGGTEWAGQRSFRSANFSSNSLIWSSLILLP